jgi:hypothetical protein
MSKSKDNTLDVLATPDELWAKLRGAVTDEQRLRRADPGRPEVCNVPWHRLLSPATTVAEIDASCRAAAIGCIDCKKKFQESLLATLDPIREKAAALYADPDSVFAMLAEGAKKARRSARDTMTLARARCGSGRRPSKTRSAVFFVDQRDRTVVHAFDPHMGPEAPRGATDAFGTDGVAKDAVKRFRRAGRHRSAEIGSALPGVSEQRELRDGEDRAADVPNREVHPPFRIREDACGEQSSGEGARDGLGVARGDAQNTRRPGPMEPVSSASTVTRASRTR